MPSNLSQAELAAGLHARIEAWRNDTADGSLAGFVSDNAYAILTALRSNASRDVEAVINGRFALLNWQKYNDDQANEIVYQAEKMARALAACLATLSGGQDQGGQEQEDGRWRPIATAPRDKTHVALLAKRSDGSVTYGHGWYMPMDGWRCWNPQPYASPTHWFPLPDPFAPPPREADDAPNPPSRNPSDTPSSADEERAVELLREARGELDAVSWTILHRARLTDRIDAFLASLGEGK